MTAELFVVGHLYGKFLVLVVYQFDAAASGWSLSYVTLLLHAREGVAATVRPRYLARWVPGPNVFLLYSNLSETPEVIGFGVKAKAWVEFDIIKYRLTPCSVDGGGALQFELNSSAAVDVFVFIVSLRALDSDGGPHQRCCSMHILSRRR